MSDFKPIRTVEGYLPIEDHGLIGDGSTAALAARDGAISWLCIPRFDSPPLLCRILDARMGGAFTVAPEDLIESRQFYETDTAMLVTEMRARDGLVRVTDAMTLHADVNIASDVVATRRELLRFVEVLDGSPRLRMELDLFGGADVEGHGEDLRVRVHRQPKLELHLASSIKLEGARMAIPAHAGEKLWFILRWGGHRRYRPHSPAERLEATRRVWRRWTRAFAYDGPKAEMVRRAAITLKLLADFETAAIVAAPTSSLPEQIGNVRNWDYRYAWMRDASLAVYALHRIGHTEEAAGFLGWALDAIDHTGRPRVLYTVGGHLAPREEDDGQLEGYRKSRPVRWGNGAVDQDQHDICGEILDCAYQWAVHHSGKIDERLWTRLHQLVELAGGEWNKPDQGIWEVRTSGRPFTYSAAMSQVALDRGAELAERFRLPADTARWRATSEQIRQAILDEGWDPAIAAIAQHLGGGTLDASVLTLPLRGVVPPDHPRMKATVEAVRRHLDAGNGLLYRYLQSDSPDGLPGGEGAFLMCSFWLVENLALQDRMQEAMDLFGSLCGHANGLGLLPEEIDPASGEFRGNYPQAFSHIGLISAGVALSRRLKR